LDSRYENITRVNHDEGYREVPFLFAEQIKILRAKIQDPNKLKISNKKSKDFLRKKPLVFSFLLGAFLELGAWILDLGSWFFLFHILQQQALHCPVKRTIFL